jgi:hypothetical protein
MGQQFEEWINDPQFRKIAPEYQRIATGNFIGTMANVSSALAANVLSKARASSPSGERKLRFDLLVKLVKWFVFGGSYEPSMASFPVVQCRAVSLWLQGCVLRLEYH